MNTALVADAQVGNGPDYGACIWFEGPWFLVTIDDESTAQVVDEIGLAVAASQHAALRLPPEVQMLAAYACILPGETQEMPPLMASLTVLSRPTHPSEQPVILPGEGEVPALVEPVKEVEIGQARFGPDEPEVEFATFTYLIHAPWGRTFHFQFLTPNVPYFYQVERWFDAMATTIQLGEITPNAAADEAEDETGDKMGDEADSQGRRT